MKRREPTIQKLARNHNKIVHQMCQLVQAKKAPRSVVVPLEIPIKGLFDLDVDDVIWEDIGLVEEENGEQIPPAWLCNEEVRKGIRGILLRDRCDEEFQRLRHEIRSMREWLCEEWQVVKETIEVVEEMGKCITTFMYARLTTPFIGELDLLHQVRQRKVCLARLCVVWNKALALVPHEKSLPEWGPSVEDLSAAEIELGSEILTSTDNADSDDNGDIGISEEIGWGDSDSDFDEDELDLGLVEYIDALAVHVVTEENEDEL